MTSPRRWPITLTAMLLILGACQSPGGGATRPAPDTHSPPSSSPKTRAVVLMPDLVGMASAEAGRRIGEIEGTYRLGISSSWRSQVIARCGTRPDSVTRQRPAPGTPLKRRTVVQVRTAALDLDKFRGPCEPTRDRDARRDVSGARLSRKRSTTSSTLSRRCWAPRWPDSSPSTTRLTTKRPVGRRRCFPRPPTPARPSLREGPHRGVARLIGGEPARPQQLLVSVDDLDRGRKLVGIDPDDHLSP